LHITDWSMLSYDSWVFVRRRRKADRLLAWYCLDVCSSVCDDVSGSAKLYSYSRSLPIHFFRHFCFTMYRSDTNGEKADGHQKQTSVWNCN